MYVVGSVDFAGAFDLGVGFDRFPDQIPHLFFIRSVPFDRFDNQAVRRASGLFGKCSYPGAQFWW
jgi:hypothetical protein